MHALKSKFRGALLGVAVGDALGAPLEGSAWVNRAQLERLRENPGPLRYTDDTHMTIGVAESLIAARGFDGAHMAKTFARNYHQEPWRGYGPGPPQVFRLLEEGAAWDQAGRAMFGGAGSFGNGAAMRATPVGLAFHSDATTTAYVAGQSALITHAHELGMDGAVAQSCAVGLLVREVESGHVDAASLLSHVATHVSTPLFIDKLEQVGLLLSAGQVAPEEAVSRLGNGIAAHEAVPVALYAFLRYPDSFADAVLFAIGLGGDTDTIGSMAAALAGAYLGEAAIPAGWRDGVEGGPLLQRLADDLLDLSLHQARPRQ
jgi:poly(ADP-ribose) glycohydrolase ARH3